MKIKLYMEEFGSRSRSITRSMSMVVDAPLPDVSSILSEINQGSLSSQSERIYEELKRLSDFQKESIREIVEKAQIMITDIIWQRDQQIARVKEDCSAKAVELQSLINFFQSFDNGRRASRIIKPYFNQPVLEYQRKIELAKHNWLRKNSISVKFTQNGLEKIQSSKVLSQQLDSMYEEIPSASSLTQLIINRKIGDDGARHLSHILPYFSNLSILILTSNFFGPRGGKFIASGISQLSKLYKLSINNDKIKEGIVSIISVLPCLKGLEEIYLSTGIFYEREAAHIGNALSIMNNLKNFTLLGGVIEARGTERLSSGLIYLTHLKTLDLSGNSIGQGVEIVCITLQNLIQLECLKLSANNFGSEAGDHLGRLLGHLGKLEEFWINSNKLTDSGLLDLIKQGEFGLKNFNLQDNEISVMGAKVLIQKCADWKNLEILDLSWNNFDDSFADIFKGCAEKFNNISLNLCGMNLNEKFLISLGLKVSV